MVGKHKNAFFAFPSGPNDLTTPVHVATECAKRSDSKLEIRVWPQMDVFGASIPNEVRQYIHNADVLVCDITIPNRNVYYEAGFAIGRGKSLAPVVNTSFANAVAEIQRDGLFDNIGFKPYENSDQLCDILLNLPDTNLINLYGKPLNFQQPLYVLDTFRKTDFRNSIISSVKGARVFYRSFDPVEVPRFSAVPIVGEVTASAGIIVPFLAEHIDDAARHNLRAAFLAGLSHGLERQTLLLQMQTSGSPAAPADYRELITPVRAEVDVDEIVSAFAKNAVVAGQSISQTYVLKEKSVLQKLTLGASAAENEFRTLEEYFVETAEFVRTLRGEVGVVAGRKGSGKTAIFF